MTLAPDDLTIRPITGPEELELFRRLPYVLDEELAGDLAGGRRRPGWLWVALRGDRLLARAAWWGQAGAKTPFLLDVFDLDDDDPGPGPVAAGERLLRAALAEVVPAGAVPPEYLRFVPPDWRDSAPDRLAVERRLAVIGRTGARPLVERLRLEWRPGTPLPPPSGRLAFRPMNGDGELLALMTRVLDGTLDAHSRADLTRMPAADAARKHFEQELAHLRSPREWWRIATLPDGEPVGFVTPGHNDYNAVIGYLAVLPSHRGHGYIDDILAEGTRLLAAQDVPRIRAATDVGNVPMAAAFHRAGYVTFERVVSLTWD
ncbi:GNAT family N-acetyltransferase [Nonomuraea sp. NPDC050328]|uniref:GNAT family N-acetyltransferase n=1 Tax=Nonomuraea sp. NPDC050328 TaxID=3364361 RepID=UPI0037A9E7EE